MVQASLAFVLMDNRKKFRNDSLVFADRRGDYKSDFCNRTGL